MTITIEQLEQLAAQMEEEDSAGRARLARLIAAYARIVAARDPARVRRGALERSDEDGHWDSSFPPSIELKDRRGPRLIHGVGIAHTTTDIATSGGFYYTWRRETTEVGLYVGADGTLYGCTETGTGSVGQYAAHPGDCGVECSLEYDEIDLDTIPLDELRMAEGKLRELAFPLVAERTALTPS